MQAADIQYDPLQTATLMSVVLTLDWFMDRCRSKTVMLSRFICCLSH